MRPTLVGGAHFRMISARMRRAIKVLLISSAAAGVAALGAGCGSQSLSVPKSDPTYRGAVLFSQRCSGCHTLERVKVQHRTKQEWRESTAAMIDQGAVLTPEETNMLLDYLVKNFGPEAGQ